MSSLANWHRSYLGFGHHCPCQRCLSLCRRRIWTVPLHDRYLKPKQVHNYVYIFLVHCCDSTWTFLGRRLRIEHNKEGPQPIKSLHFEKLLSDWSCKIRQHIEFSNKNPAGAPLIFFFHKFFNFLICPYLDMISDSYYLHGFLLR